MSPLKSKFALRLEQECSAKRLPKELLESFLQIELNYIGAFKLMGEDISPFYPLLEKYLDIVLEQCISPHEFQSYHQRITQPFDYTQFGLDFIRPLLDVKKSKITHPEIVNKIEGELRRGENVILLSNHQAEPDPQAISLLLEKEHPALSKEMIFVAGHRVTQDPFAIAFSLGRNLLCIYSKKHIDYPPELRAEKQQHNQKTMKKMRELLSLGGKCIFVAPSGGRDRPNAQGVVDVSPFDPQSIEMFRLMAAKAGTPTHFYPLALETYHWFPPPDQVGKELGEQRLAHRSGVTIAFGQEIDMDSYPGKNDLERKLRREHLTHHIWSLVSELYWEGKK